MFAQRFDSAGNKQGTEFQVNGSVKAGRDVTNRIIVAGDSDRAPALAATLPSR